jgi:hypothetical protein
MADYLADGSGPVPTTAEALARLDETMVDLLMTGGGVRGVIRRILLAGPWVGLPGAETMTALETATKGRRTTLVAAHTLGLRQDAASDWQKRTSATKNASKPTSKLAPACKHLSVTTFASFTLGVNYENFRTNRIRPQLGSRPMRRTKRQH